MRHRTPASATALEAVDDDTQQDEDHANEDPEVRRCLEPGVLVGMADGLDDVADLEVGDDIGEARYGHDREAELRQSGHASRGAPLGFYR